LKGHQLRLRGIERHEQERGRECEVLSHGGFGCLTRSVAVGQSLGAVVGQRGRDNLRLRRGRGERRTVAVGFLCPGDAAHAVASTCLSMPLRNGLRAVHIGLDTHIFLAMNASWHNKHPMPARATLPQRVKWHLAHAKHCGCRPMPKTVRAELRRVAPAAPKRRDRAG
jgi:hypothetical protein